MQRTFILSIAVLEHGQSKMIGAKLKRQLIIDDIIRKNPVINKLKIQSILFERTKEVISFSTIENDFADMRKMGLMIEYDYVNDGYYHADNDFRIWKAILKDLSNHTEVPEEVIKLIDL